MRRLAVRSLWALLFLAFGAGCSEVNVAFVRQKDTRAALERSLRLNYTFRYQVESTGILGGLFSSTTIKKPRLLYSLTHETYVPPGEGFVDTGADFFPGRAVWQIASPRKLHGRTATFVIVGDNVDRPAVTRLAFPTSGCIDDLSISWEGDNLVFRLDTKGQVFDPVFRLCLLNRTQREITVRPRGPDVFVWSYTSELRPTESRLPIHFRVDYNDWYKTPALEPFVSTPIYIAPNVTFESVNHLPDRPGTVEVVFKAWGKTGLLDFRYAKDGRTFEAVKGMSDPVIRGDSFRATWDLARNGLADYTGALTLEARSSDRLLGHVEVLPPGPVIRIVSAVQEDDLLRIRVALHHVPPATLQVFAGTKNRQRELRADELVSRTATEIVMRHREFPRELGGRLFVFLSARNAAGLTSAEKEVDLIWLGVRSVRQDGPTIEVLYHAVPPSLPVKLRFKDPVTGALRTARSVQASPGRLAWDFLADIPKGTPAVLRLTLTAEQGGSHVTARAEASPLAAVLGTPRRLSPTTYVLPCRIFGAADYIKFSYRSGDGRALLAKNARYLPARNEIHWNLWGDLRKSTYGGQAVVLRCTLINRTGQASFESAPLYPLYVRIASSKQRAGRMDVTVQGSREIASYAFFYSFADRGEFHPLKPSARKGDTFTFDLSSLGRTYSTFLRLRVVGITADRSEAEDTGTLRLVAGFQPAAASWSGKYLWVSYTVSWKVSEEDVRFACFARKDGRSVGATTPMKRVFDVNHRAVAWDVYADLTRLGVFELSDVGFRIDIRDPDQGSFSSVVSFDRLPLPPLRLEGKKVNLSGSSLSFSFQRMTRSSSQPAYSVRDYKIEAEYFCPHTQRFRSAQPASGGEKPRRFVWKRRQSMDAVKAGTWVRLIVTRRNQPGTVGLALFHVTLKPDHPFFDDDEEY